MPRLLRGSTLRVQAFAWRPVRSRRIEAPAQCGGLSDTMRPPLSKAGG